MTKIEERAEEWAESRFYEEFKGAAFISYVKGANDQKAIDDEEYRKTKREELIDKACEWLKGELYDTSIDISSYNCWTVKELVNAFRNYLLNNE